jgi:phage N-6-adenine-methyltransferase
VSNQIVSTPREFIDAVEERFGCITFDLAANAENSKAMCETEYFGPGSKHGENAFLKSWQGLGDLAWLNPPFADIEPWAERCALSCKLYKQRIALLVPAAVCTNYFVNHINPHAYRFELTPRIFKVEIRDCVLAMYEPGGYTGIQTWNWKE